MQNPFIADQYFNDYPSKILGEQVESSRWNKTYIRIKGGSLDGIECPVIEKTFIAPDTTITATMEEVAAIVANNANNANNVKSAAAAKLAVGEPVNNTATYTFREMFDMYNPDISREELEAYLYCRPGLPWKKYIDRFEHTEDELIRKGLIFVCKAHHLKAPNGRDYRYTYLSGNVAEKLAQARNRDNSYIIQHFGQDVFDAQIAALESVMPARKTLGDSFEESERIILLPHSNLSQDFYIDELMDGTQFSYSKTLMEAFIEWLRKLPDSEYTVSSANDIIPYYLYNKAMPIKKADRSKEEIEKDERMEVYTRQRAKEDGDRLFTKFIQDALIPEDKLRLEYLWNEKFNGLVEINYDKIPIAFRFGKYFKHDTTGKWRLRKIQRDGIAFLAEKMSGINAYDVGVGKTLTAIGHMSYCIDHDLCRYPLVVVPDNVYKKTANEMMGFDEEEEELEVQVEFDDDEKAEGGSITESLTDPRLDDYYRSQYSVREMEAVEKGLEQATWPEADADHNGLDDSLDRELLHLKVQQSLQHFTPPLEQIVDQMTPRPDPQDAMLREREMKQGGKIGNNSANHSYGAVEHLPKIRHLHNLNAKWVRNNIKTYSAAETASLNKLEEEKKALKQDLKEAVKTGKLPSRLLLSGYIYSNVMNDMIRQVKDKVQEQKDKIRLERRKLFIKEGHQKKLLNSQDQGPHQTSPLRPAYDKWIKELEDETKRLLDAEEFAAAAKVVVQMQKYVNALYEEEVFTTGQMIPVPPGTITMLSYDGLKKLGIRDRYDIEREIYEILEQSHLRDRRKAAQLLNKIQSRLGSVLFGSKIYIEDLGVDYFWMDEAHAAKNLFERLKGEEKESQSQDYDADYEPGKKYVVRREKTHYDISQGGPTARALIVFAISRYMYHYVGRNVVLTTATPFENSPLEVYSMLAIANYDLLVELGYKNMKDFFDTFMRITWDIKITPTNDAVFAVVLTGFQNLPEFRTLIRYFIDHVTGEEARVPRPGLLVLPSKEKNIYTTFHPTSEQAAMMREVEEYILGNTNLQEICKRAFDEETEGRLEGKRAALKNPALSEEERKELAKQFAEENPDEYYALLDENEKKAYLEEKRKAIGAKYEELSEKDQLGVRVMRGLSMMRQIALSPWLFKCKKVLNIMPGYTQYVESSPKLQYVMACVRSVREYHLAHGQPVSGQIIYMNSGTEFFHLIKDYLVNVIGFADEEVAMIGGKHANTSAKREAIKDGFLANDIKVLIGTSAIMYGVDLQNATSVGYNCYYDWNPTTAHQFSGRFQRQGNKFITVRLVYPMLQNSSDSIMFQYLQEKTSRLKDIWDKNGQKSQLDLRDFDPEQLKYDLITDPQKKAKVEVLRDQHKLDTERIRLEKQEQTVSRLIPAAQQLQTYRGIMEGVLTQWAKRVNDNEIDRMKRDFEAKKRVYEEEVKKYQEDLDNIDKRTQEWVIANHPLKISPADKKAMRDKEVQRLTEKITAKKSQIAAVPNIIKQQTEKKQAALQSDMDIYKFEAEKPEEVRNRDKFIYIRAGHMKEWLDSPIGWGTANADKFYSSNETRLRSQLINYRGAYAAFYDLKKKVMDPLRITEADIHNVQTIFQQRIQAITDEIDKIEADMPQRVARITQEIASQAKYWKTPQQAADDFASVNHPLLDEVITPVAASVTSDDETEFFLQEQRIRLIKKQHEHKMKMLKLKELKEQSAQQSAQHSESELEVVEPEPQSTPAPTQSPVITPVNPFFSAISLPAQAKQSAGILFIDDDGKEKKAFLVHPTNASWFKTYSVPKGEVEPGEDLRTAAIREVQEETGIITPPALLADINPVTVDYTANGKLYKQAQVFVVNLSASDRQALNIPDKVSKDKLQSSEVDWAGFVPVSELDKRMLPRQLEVLKTFF